MTNSRLEEFQKQLALMQQAEAEADSRSNMARADADAELDFRRAQANNNAQMQMAEMQAQLANRRANANVEEAYRRATVNAGQDTRLNQYGDPVGTVYRGGSPNFYGDYTGVDGTFTPKSTFDGSSKPAKEKPKAGRQASKTSRQAAKALSLIHISEPTRPY